MANLIFQQPLLRSSVSHDAENNFCCSILLWNILYFLVQKNSIYLKYIFFYISSWPFFTIDKIIRDRFLINSIQHIKIISERSCYTEVMSDENSS